MEQAVRGTAHLREPGLQQLGEIDGKNHWQPVLEGENARRMAGVSALKTLRSRGGRLGGTSSSRHGNLPGNGEGTGSEWLDEGRPPLRSPRIQGTRRLSHRRLTPAVILSGFVPQGCLSLSVHRQARRPEARRHQAGLRRKRESTLRLRPAPHTQRIGYPVPGSSEWALELKSAVGRSRADGTAGTASKVRRQRERGANEVQADGEAGRVYEPRSAKQNNRAIGHRVAP